MRQVDSAAEEQFVEKIAQRFPQIRFLVSTAYIVQTFVVLTRDI